LKKRKKRSGKSAALVGGSDWASLDLCDDTGVGADVSIRTSL